MSVLYACNGYSTYTKSITMEIIRDISQDTQRFLLHSRLVQDMPFCSPGYIHLTYWLETASVNYMSKHHQNKRSNVPLPLTAITSQLVIEFR